VLLIKKESTLKTDIGRVNCHIRPMLGKRQLSTIDKSDVEKLMRDTADGLTTKIAKARQNNRANVKGGKGTASRTVGILGAIFTFAIERGFLEYNPAHGIKKYRDNKIECFLSLAQLKKLGEIFDLLETEGTGTGYIAYSCSNRRQEKRNC